MPTEIKVVLPTPDMDDIMSVADAFSTTEDAHSVNEESFVDFDTEVIATVHKSNKDTSSSSSSSSNTEQKPSDEIFKNVNVNLTKLNPPSPGEPNPKSFQKCNVTSVSLDTSTSDCPSEKETNQRRVRSAKIEHLIHQSSRESLVTSVRNDALHRPSSRESLITSNRNGIHRLQRPNQCYSKRNGNTNNTTQQQKQKSPLTKVENKFTQTSQSEESCQKDQQSEMLQSEGGKKTNGGWPQKRPIRPSSSPARLRQRPVSPKPRTVNNVKLSITGTYDIELEHRDIMMKALYSYHQHRHRDKPTLSQSNETTMNGAENGDDRGQRSAEISSPENHSRHSLSGNSSILRDILASVGESTDIEKRDYSCNKVQLIYDDDKLVSRIWTDEKKKEETFKRNNRKTNSTGIKEKDQSLVINGRPASSKSRFDSDKTFKLARCRLIYNEEPKKPKTRPKSSYSWSERSTSLIDDDVTSGVLVDSVGHVYGRSKPRPLSALPCKFHVYLQERTRTHYDGGRGGWNMDRKYYP